MFCPNCGHKVEGEQKFCTQCGVSLGGVMGVKKGGSSRWPKILGIVGGVVAVVVIVALLIGSRGSPIDVAMAFYKAGNEGNYDKAYSYLAPEVRMGWEIMGAFMPSFDNSMDAATKGGTIARIEAKETVEYSGAFATVWLTLDYKDGSREQDVLTLIKVDRGWRVYVSTLLLMPSYP